MTFALRMGKLVIGRSELEEEGAAGGERRGAFRPGFGWQLVEPVFALLAEAQPDEHAPARDPEKLARYERARDALQLQLVDQAGVAHPATRIDVRPAGRESDGEPALTIVVRLAGDTP